MVTRRDTGIGRYTRRQVAESSISAGDLGARWNGPALTPEPPVVTGVFVDARGGGGRLGSSGEGAFGGFHAPSPSRVADRRIERPERHAQIAPSRIRPVRYSEFGAGNLVRSGVVGILREWWRWRRIMGGEYFVARPERFTQAVDRSMDPPRQLGRVLPTRRVFYKPRFFGSERQEGAGQEAPEPQFSHGFGKRNVHVGIPEAPQPRGPRGRRRRPRFIRGGHEEG